MFDDEKKRGDKRKEFIWIYSSTRRSTFCWYELRQIFSSVSSPRLLLKINNPLFHHHENSLPPSSIHTIIILGTRWMNFRIYVRQNILNFCVGDSTRLSTFVFFCERWKDKNQLCLVRTSRRQQALSQFLSSSSPPI